MSIDTANSAELIAGIHITEGSIYVFERLDPYGLLDTTSHVSHKDDGSAFLDSFTDSNKSEDTIGDDDVTNNSTSESIKPDFRIGER